MQSWFDQILEQAAALRGIDDAARAEAWVSGVFGEWRQPGVADDVDPATLDRQFLEHVRLNGGEVGLALALAARALGDDAIVETAIAVADELSGVYERPAWAADIGTAEPRRAASLRQGGSESIVVEYEHDAGARHSMLVEIEHDSGARAVDILFGPGDILDSTAGDERLEREELSLDEAGRRVRCALDRTDAGPEAEPAETLVMNRLLAEARLAALPGIERVEIPATPSMWTLRPRDTEGDAAAVELLRSALRGERGCRPPEPDRTEAEAAVAELLGDGDPDASALAAAADDGSLVGLAGAYVAPRRLDGFTAAERAAILDLEWADWLGAVVQLVREGAGADASPPALVGAINRCPEVTTTIPKRDAASVAHAFSLTLHAWVLTGAVDDAGGLTALGAWLLPRALAHAWGSTFD